MYQAFIFLLAAVVSVPIARRLGLGSVLGYLLAGVLIGPYALELVGDDMHDVMHFAEFGVVMMLFLIGLEMEPAKLWRLRVPILGLGAAQVAITAGLITVVALLLSVPWRESLAVGLILALSSTAIVLQMLREKGLIKTEAGKSAFSVLLFQDIAVIPLLALLPLLAVQELVVEQKSFHAELQAWQQVLLVIGIVASIILAGRFLVRPLFRFVAATRMRELLTATALLLVIGITLLMELAGLSAALGTFLAGVVLADSEYRHELEAEIDPFKSLLLGLFFISVGANIDFPLLASEPLPLVGLVVLLIALKVLVLYVLARVFKLRRGQRFLFSLALAQGGEFAFVLFAFALQVGVLEQALVSSLTLVVALSMAMTPLLLLFHEKWIYPRLDKGEDSDAEADEVDDGETPVILAGYGRFGQIVGRFLRMNGYDVTVLEHDVAQVELVRRFGHKVFFGDASRQDLLHAAGIESAQLLVLTLADHKKTLDIVNFVRKDHPHINIMARALGRREAQELMRAGVDYVVRDTFHSAMHMGEQALQCLGFSETKAARAAGTFRQWDEEHLLQLVDYLHDEKEYISRTRRNSEELERVLKADNEAHDIESSH